MASNETYYAIDIVKSSIHEVIRERYDLRNSDTEKVVEKVINFIENECLK